MLRMLNIGCGDSYHDDWVNLDLIASSASVIPCDITKGLPFPSGSFDVCYSSHCLEHLRSAEADCLIEEQRRILRPAGIIRVVVPDLEVICRNYVKYLDEVLAERREHAFRYDFTLLELLDQVTRDRSWGQFAELGKTATDQQAMEFMIERFGKEAAEGVLRQYRDDLGHAPGPAVSRATKIWRTLRRRWSSMAKQHAAGLSRRFLLGREFRRWGSVTKQRAAEFAIRLLLGTRAVESLREGLFRNSGEIHRWMYDRYSLGRLLVSHGFQEVQAVAAAQSRIPNFAQYGLETFEGRTRKPNSLFMEAIRGP